MEKINYMKLMRSNRKILIVCFVLSIFLLPPMTESYILTLLLLGMLSPTVIKIEESMLFILLFGICLVLLSTVITNFIEFNGAVLSVEHLTKFFLISVAFIISGERALNKLDRLQLQKLLFFILLIVFMSQIAISFNLSPFSSFIKSYYIKSEVLSNFYKREVIAFDVRNGGLFGNPNQLSKAVTFLVAYFLIIRDTQNKYLFKVTDIIFIGVALLAILLSGSRTGFLISVMIILLFIFPILDLKKKVLFFFLTLIGGGFIVFYSELRVFSFASGNGVGSLDYKVSFIYEYISLTLDKSPLTFWFGHGFMEDKSSYDTLIVYGVNLGFDSDLGFIIYFLGGIGLVWLIISLFFLNRFYSVPTFCLPLVFWTISSSVFYSIKTLFMVIILFLLTSTFRKN
ncbi:hypothetical protein [Pseudoalteromonas sp. SCSIO 43101]|uniref:hypothetical protein n=1 Tax=Pseudoalteromonas sp. SCSIO 43101 TaxID=2822847 RepID=UPI00202AD6AC|nr:hypothetical protein [Pseudoalteromonas sp. SCSIO 43101]URQ90144.1 hypothetical protein J8Z25_15530 [Pseudoalteromonas sp. SCSIO 43101]